MVMKSLIRFLNNVYDGSLNRSVYSFVSRHKQGFAKFGESYTGIVVGAATGIIIWQKSLSNIDKAKRQGKALPKSFPLDITSYKTEIGQLGASTGNYVFFILTFGSLGRLTDFAIYLLSLKHKTRVPMRALAPPGLLFFAVAGITAKYVDQKCLPDKNDQSSYSRTM